jgi:hypothetical protein
MMSHPLVGCAAVGAEFAVPGVASGSGVWLTPHLIRATSLSTWILLVFGTYTAATLVAEQSNQPFHLKLAQTTDEESHLLLVTSHKNQNV